MAPNPRVAKAFRAMRELGIPEEKTKPALKNLLRIFDKNWELIEEENYRALADAIFESEETEAVEQMKVDNAEAEEQKKKMELAERMKVIEEEAQIREESERPLKRLRLRHQDSQASPSCINSSCGSSLKMPEVEIDELPEAQPQLQFITRNGSQPVSPQAQERNKGKQPVLPCGLAQSERSDRAQPEDVEKTHPDVTDETESDTVIIPRLRDKGKKPLLPQTGSPANMLTPDRSYHAVSFKEPNLNSDTINVSKEKTYTLIKPKDEPLTDDTALFEVPVAAIRPELLTNGESSTENNLASELHGSHLSPSPSAANKDLDGSIRASTNGICGHELGNIPDESTAKLDIASSSYGEIKISLSCNSALGKPKLADASVATLLKAMEDKCLKSYKVLDPNFSVKKLMKDVCDCLLDLETNPSNNLLVGADTSPPADSLETCPALAAGSKGMLSNVNGSSHHEGEASLPRSPKLPIENTENSCATDKHIEQNGFDTEPHNLVAVSNNRSTPNDVRSIHDVSDIAKGQEGVIISLVNQVNSECPPSFHYISQNAVFQNAYVNFSLARIGDDNCCSNCFGDCLMSETPCACALQSGGEYAYTKEGLVREEIIDECVEVNRDPQQHCLFYCKECPLERSKNDESLEPCKGHSVRSFIKECWLKCGCNKHCGNRVVQRGIKHKLQVFMTSTGKGWGLRTLEDLPKGAFVCEYVGEVLTNAELYDRVSRNSNKEEPAFPVLLDADWGAESELKDEEALCLDATYYGNVARSINHRCSDSNLVEIPVEVETSDHHYYHLAFFTTRKVKALEELTWDYGIDFDDDDHPVKAFQCQCGSSFCRNNELNKKSRRKRRRIT